MVEKLAPSDVDIFENIRLASDEPDWTSEVQRLGGYAPDVLFVIAPEAVAVRLLQTMAKVGYTPPALLAMGDGLTDPTFAATLGSVADYVSVRTAWSPEIGQKKPLAAAVAAAYRAEFGRDMTEAAARDFEATLTLGMAIEAADSTDAARIRSALAATDISTTIMGWQAIRFDGSGQNTLASGVVEQLTKGQYHVVYPTPVATTDVVWPMPALNKR
jgi:branched-chain amino acid transport system substrate-binding protein